MEQIVEQVMACHGRISQRHRKTSINECNVVRVFLVGFFQLWSPDAMSFSFCIRYCASCPHRHIVSSYFAVKDPEQRMRFGLDSEGFSATEGDCTRWVLQRHNHVIHPDTRVLLDENESLNLFLVSVGVNHTTSRVSAVKAFRKVVLQFWSAGF